MLDDGKLLTWVLWEDSLHLGEDAVGEVVEFLGAFLVGLASVDPDCFHLWDAGRVDTTVQYVVVVVVDRDPLGGAELVEAAEVNRAAALAEAGAQHVDVHVLALSVVGALRPKVEVSIVLHFELLLGTLSWPER